MPNASIEAIQLLELMFKFDSTKRPKCEHILKHSYFTNHIAQSEIQNAFDIIKGRRPSESRKKNDIESLKIGPNGI